MNHARQSMFAYPGVVANFPTVYDPAIAAFGPVHRHPRQGPWLGDTVTLEEDADQGADEDCINNIAPLADKSNQDGGDDGLIEWPPMAHCQEVHDVTIAVTYPSGAAEREYYLNMWVDWNHNGSWGDTLDCGFAIASEWVVANSPVLFPAAGTHLVRVSFLAWRDETDLPVWVRVTLSERPAEAADGSGPPEGYEYGETEDYLLPLMGRRVYLPVIARK